MAETVVAEVKWGDIDWRELSALAQNRVIILTVRLFVNALSKQNKGLNEDSVFRIVAIQYVSDQNIIMYSSCWGLIFDPVTDL